jgi:hypothetical protein
MSLIILGAGRGLDLTTIEIIQQEQVVGATLVAFSEVFKPVGCDMNGYAFASIFHRKSDVVRIRDADRKDSGK